MEQRESADDFKVAYLIVKWHGEEVYREALTAPITIGRQMGVDVWINDPALSRQHCRIEPDGDGHWRVVDLHSRNGVYVNHHRVELQMLNEDDAIRIGDARIIFHAGAVKAKRPQSPEEAMFATHMRPMEKLAAAHHPSPQLAATTTMVKQRPAAPQRVSFSPTPGEPVVKPFGLAFQREPAKPVLDDETTKDESGSISSTPASGSGSWLGSWLRSLRSRLTHKRNVA